MIYNNNQRLSKNTNFFCTRHTSAIRTLNIVRILHVRTLMRCTTLQSVNNFTGYYFRTSVRQ